MATQLVASQVVLSSTELVSGVKVEGTSQSERNEVSDEEVVIIDIHTE
jgi:hypothetical protein